MFLEPDQPAADDAVAHRRMLDVLVGLSAGEWANAQGVATRKLLE